MCLTATPQLLRINLKVEGQHRDGAQEWAKLPSGNDVLFAKSMDPASRLKLRTQKIFKLQLKKTRGSWEDQVYSILLLSQKQKCSADISVLQSAFLTTFTQSFLYLFFYIRTDILISTNYEEENNFRKGSYHLF